MSGGTGGASSAGPAQKLLIAVSEYLDGHCPHLKRAPGWLPEEHPLLLELHPDAYVLLRRDPYTQGWPSYWGDIFGVDVELAPGWLPTGTWRLMCRPGDVLLGGKL